MANCNKLRTRALKKLKVWASDLSRLLLGLSMKFAVVHQNWGGMWCKFCTGVDQIF